MSDLRFEYKDGRVVGAVLDLAGPNDFRVKLSDIDEDEVKRLQEAYRNVDPAKLSALNKGALDGLSLEEKQIIAKEISDAMGVTGVNGSFSFEHGGIEHLYSVITQEQQGFLAQHRNPTELEKQFTAGFEEATGIKGIHVDRNKISFSGDGKELRMDLRGLSEDDAHQLENYLVQHPEQAETFSNMLRAVGEDMQITDAERDLVNNDTEQLLVGAGVSADVVPASIAAAPVPAFTGFKRR